jgi:hypothetical protein
VGLEQGRAGAGSDPPVTPGAPTAPDPSHPAFYLPGQELIGVNSRGFWVLDPCKADGSACAPSCSNEFDTCLASSDRCNPALQCLAGRCSVVSIC